MHVNGEEHELVDNMEEMVDEMERVEKFSEFREDNVEEEEE